MIDLIASRQLLSTMVLDRSLWRWSLGPFVEQKAVKSSFIENSVGGFHPAILEGVALSAQCRTWRSYQAGRFLVHPPDSVPHGSLLLDLVTIDWGLMLGLDGRLSALDASRISTRTTDKYMDSRRATSSSFPDENSFHSDGPRQSFGALRISTRMAGHMPRLSTSY